MKDFEYAIVLMIVLVMIICIYAVMMMIRQRRLDNDDVEARSLRRTYERYLQGDVSLEEWSEIQQRADEARARRRTWDS